MPSTPKVRDVLRAGYVPITLRTPIGTTANITQLLLYTEDCPKCVPSYRVAATPLASHACLSIVCQGSKPMAAGQYTHACVQPCTHTRACAQTTHTCKTRFGMYGRGLSASPPKTGLLFGWTQNPHRLSWHPLVLDFHSCLTAGHVPPAGTSSRNSPCKHPSNHVPRYCPGGERLWPLPGTQSAA